MTEVEALKRFIPILGRISPPGERVIITRSILERIAGRHTAIMGVNYKQAGALAWPNDTTKAGEFESAMDNAVDAGEFVSFIHRIDRRHFQIEELASWPGCPAIAPDSPLVFWLGEPVPAQTAATSAPVGAVGPFGGVEPDKSGPLPVEQGLLTKDVAACFDNCYYSADNWPKRLSGTAWLKTACIGRGEAGGASAVWNPLTLARLIHQRTKGNREKKKLIEALNSRFTRIPALGPWRNAFNEYFETYYAVD